MVSKIITIHYPTLVKVLDELSAKNPQRTKSHLDILRDNFAKNAFETLQTDTTILEINHPDEHVTMLWEEFKGHYYGIPTYGLQEDDQWILYSSVMNAIYTAKELWKYDEIFKEVIPAKKTN